MGRWGGGYQADEHSWWIFAGKDEDAIITHVLLTPSPRRSEPPCHGRIAKTVEGVLQGRNSSAEDHQEGRCPSTRSCRGHTGTTAGPNTGANSRGRGGGRRAANRKARNIEDVGARMGHLGHLAWMLALACVSLVHAVGVKDPPGYNWMTRWDMGKNMDLEFLVTLHGLTEEEEQEQEQEETEDEKEDVQKKEKLANIMQLSLALPKSSEYWNPKQGPKNVKLSKSAFSTDVKEPRGMLQLPNGDLLITDARTHHSKLWKLKHCNFDKKTPIHEFASHGLHHPYALALSSRNTVLVANQNCPDSTCRVSEYDLKGKSMGHFISIPGSKDSIALRGIAVDARGDVYVAARGMDKLLRYDADGNKVGELEVKKPLSVFYDASMDAIYISSRTAKKKMGRESGAVYQYTPSDGRMERKFVLGGKMPMSHPAGVFSYSGTLYVLEQYYGRLLAFNIKTGEFLTTLADDMDNPESLMIRACDGLDVPYSS